MSGEMYLGLVSFWQQLIVLTYTVAQVGIIFFVLLVNDAEELKSTD
jgi:hypothetical protein